MQPGAPQQPQQHITRRYLTDAQYTADAARMATAGWRVSALSRDVATNQIIADYVAPSTPRPPLPPLDRRMFFLGAGIGGFLVIALIVVLTFASLSPSSAAPSAAAATQTASAYTVAYAATATALANSTPAPTSLPAPTATPAPTLTPAQTYDAIAQANCNFLTASVTSRWDAAHATVSVTAQAGPQWDINALHTTVENIVFDCFKAFYTSSGTNAVQWVDVTVTGPLTDAHGNNVIGDYGQANLSRASARPFNWGNLDYLQAWNNGIYDSQWERNS